jgi:hypothetical protein
MQWRRYHGRRALNALQAGINALYTEEAKARRRDSIYRPFAGDYLDALPRDIVENVRDSMYRIIDHYNSSETVLFADASGYQVLDSQVAPIGASAQQCAAIVASGAWQLQQRLVVLTDAAIYIMEIIDNDKWDTELKKQNIKTPKPLPGLVFLRRRIPISLDINGDCLESICVSKMADNCIVLKVSQRQQSEGEPNCDHWQKNVDVARCPITEVQFTLFNRR